MTLEEAIELAIERAEDGCGTCNACTGCSGCKDVKDEFEEIAKLLTELKERREHPEVRHGRWIDNCIVYSCSECNDSVPKFIFVTGCDFNLCPYCGAKMDGGAENA